MGTHRRLARGFTLIELLTAVAIMALLALLSWRAIDGMGRTQTVTQSRSESQQRLQAGLLQWTLDLDAITDTLVAGGEVNFTGFGKFHVAMRNPRQGVNPRTGERITIAGGRVPRFSAGSGLKKKVKEG